MIVTKVHRVISFDQSAWMKKYIDFNINMRCQAKNEFEKNFFKLMNNSVFGKTMENVRKHINVTLVQNKRQLLRLTAKPNFKSFKIISKDLISVHTSKTEVALLKPVYVGASILDISKVFMVKFHYDKIKQTYGDKVKLLMTDTDSFIYHITTPDLYADIALDLESYDTSQYPVDHPAYSLANGGQLGKMKDEMKSVPIKEFVGLRAKMYTILSSDGSVKKTAKGITRSAASKIVHRAYLDALYHEHSTTATMQQIRSINHQLYTISIVKTALSPYDDKRYVLPDKITTLAHGHCDI
jgi:hypothetical protein